MVAMWTGIDERLVELIERLRAAIQAHRAGVMMDTHPANGPSLFDDVLWAILADEGSDQ
jgi:hypothetical protein